MFLTLIVCFLVLWYRTDLSWTADWKSVAFNFTWQRCKMMSSWTKIMLMYLTFCEVKGGWIFLPLESFSCVSFLFQYLFFFSGYIIIKHIQDDCMNSVSVFSLKYFYFFAWSLWRASEEWQVSFCKTWNLQLFLMHKILTIDDIRVDIDYSS